MARLRRILVACLLSAILAGAVGHGAHGEATGPAPDTQVPVWQDLDKRLAAVEGTLKNRRKDVWDKVAAVSGLASALLVALIGFYATNIYSRRQKDREEARKDQDIQIRRVQAEHAQTAKERELSLEQAQILEKFLPHLASSDERTKEAALVVISSQVSDKVAADLALKFRGEGSNAALSKIAAASNAPETFGAAFGQLFASLRPSLVVIEAGDSYRANGFSFGDHDTVVTAAHVVKQGEAGIRIRAPDESILEPHEILVDETRDLALLKLHAKAHIVPVSSSNAAIELGLQVVTLWQSLSGLRGEVGTVVAIDVSSPFSKVREIGISMARMAPGMSGAPVVDASGRLVGMIHAYHPETELAYLIPANEIVAMTSDPPSAKKARRTHSPPRGRLPKAPLP